jgi:hypothetical protein
MAGRRFPNRQQAVDELAKARVDIARGMGLLPVDAKITVAQYAEQWLATLQEGPSTRANYLMYLRNHIQPAFAGSRCRCCGAAISPPSSRSWSRNGQPLLQDQASADCRLHPCGVKPGTSPGALYGRARLSCGGRCRAVTPAVPRASSAAR